MARQIKVLVVQALGSKLILQNLHDRRELSLERCPLTSTCAMACGYVHALTLHTCRSKKIKWTLKNNH